MKDGPLKRLRQGLGFSQAEMATALGMSTSQYNRAEKGFTGIPRQVWPRLGELGLSVQDILKQQEDFRANTTARLVEQIKRSVIGKSRK